VLFYSVAHMRQPISPNNPWETTGTACLLRHKHSRVYYGRFTIRGKQKWVNLDTTVLTVAKLRLPDEVKKIEQLRSLRPTFVNGKATMGELMDLYLKGTRANPRLRPASVVSRETALKKVLKTWPGIENLPPSRIKPEDVQKWATRFKSEGTQFVPPNAKKALKGNSATSVNRAIDSLRRVCDIAIRLGLIHINPVSVKPPDEDGPLRKRIEKKRLILPSRSQTERIIKRMREAGHHGGWGVEASFFCRFLLMTGARLGEAGVTTWANVNREPGTVWLAGYKTETSPRYVPLHADLEYLLDEIRAWRRKVAVQRSDRREFLDSADDIFRIKECQRSIDHACEHESVSRITHHDFRHLFATHCLEVGIDVPSVAKLLGHKDGGALVMSTYIHPREEYLKQSAEKLRFGKFE
jgi:integrase